MIVDTHVHIWEISDKYPIGPTAPTWNSYPDEPGTAEELLADMDAEGVDWTVLVQTSWSTWDNGYIADSVVRYPDRFIGHGLIDPQDPDNAEQVRYWVRERGLVGFRLHPMYYPDEKILLTEQNGPMWEEIAALNAIIQFHLRPEDADQVAAIARRYPNTVLILDHMGYPQIDRPLADYQPILDLARFDNVFFKLSDVAGRSQKFIRTKMCIPILRRRWRFLLHSVWSGGLGTPGITGSDTIGPRLLMNFALFARGFLFSRMGM